MNNYATIEDIKALWKTLTTSEQERAEALLPIVCDSLRHEANMVGKDLDKMIKDSPALLNVTKSVTVDIVARTLMTSTDTEPMVQFSQSAMGYTTSGTFLVPGGGLFIKESELARLGLRKQKLGVIDIYGD
ncbi:phage Gp19/Gp15/Gp42 family protein [Mogibacterium timidum]|uniref:phage Gp19/Gp15/Gp42 family protein n=1 Tax=Mogibacterium timidum TaxID=35519 RepID=UPI00248AD264|nr:phage Gp19/Gp15/Gp42 family protein [Mogibacterium timidum]